MKNIKIDETIPDKESLFNIKIFRYKNYKFEQLIKTIDIKNIGNYLEILKDKITDKFPIILESTKTINKLEILSSITEKERYEQNRFFYKFSKFSNFPQNIILTFKIKPPTALEKITKNVEFFDLYHSYSNFWLFIPNIKPKVTIKENNKSKVVWVVDEKRYISYVDKVYDILNYKNNKPIFVPLSIKFGIKKAKKIIENYLKKEYFYIWVDFEGTSVNERSIAIMRSIFRILEEKGRFDDVIFYLTNIKREIISHVLDEETPASDVIAGFGGGNIIGINKEPMKFGGKPSYSKEELRRHKARLLDTTSYFYIKPMSKKLNLDRTQQKLALKDVKYTTFYNTLSISNEITKQCRIFLKSFDLKKYVSNKRMFKEHPSGKKLLESMFTKKLTKKITEWF